MNWLKRWLPIAIPAVALVLGGVWTVLGTVWAASTDRAAICTTQVRQEKAIEDLGDRVDCQDERIRGNERAISAMTENVRLTREAVERIERRITGGQP